MTRARIAIAVALMLAGDAGAGELRLHEVDEQRRGTTVVRTYSDGDGVHAFTITTAGKPPVSVSPRESVPPPRLRWVSSDLLQIEYGSRLAPT